MRSGLLVAMLALLLAAPVQGQSFEAALACYDATSEKIAPEIAIVRCSTAIEADGLSPENLATVYYNRGLNYQNVGQALRAIEDYDKAIELSQNNPAAYYNRGLALARTGRAEAAIDDIQTQWRLAPDEVARDQQMLADKGYYTSVIDGIPGRGTQRALQKWVADGAP